MRKLAWLGIVAAFGAVACTKDVPETPAPLCYLSTAPESEAEDEEAPVVIRPATPDQWATLLVGTSRGTVDRACTGDAVRAPRPSATCLADVAPYGDAVPRPLDEESVVVGRVEHGRKIVWLITHETASGDGLGPIAYVEEDGRGLAVRALGMVQAPMGRPRLRWESAGSTDMAIVEGERCDDADRPETCIREARMVLRDGPLLVPAEVHHADGSCIGDAQLALSRTSTVALPSGWERTFRLSASYEVRGGVVLVHEQVVAEDHNPAIPDLPARPYRTSETDLRWAPTGRRFVANESPLWRRMVGDAGDMQSHGESAGGGQ